MKKDTSRTQAELIEKLQQQVRSLEQLQQEAAERQQLGAEALRISEEKFAKVFSASPDSIIVSSLDDGRLLEVNEGFENISGYSRDEAIGKTSTELNLWVRPEDREWFVSVLKGKRSIHDVEMDFRRKSGELFMALVSMQPFELNGEQCLVSVVRDITKHKRAEEALRDSEQQSRSLIETAPNIILCLAPDHKILEFNPEAERVFGRTRGEVLGMDYLESFIPEAERADVAADIQIVLAGKPTRGYENTLMGADGTEHLYSWNVNRLIDAQGQPSGIIAIGQDITERKRAEEAVRQARDELEQRVIERTAELALFRQFVETSGEGMGWADVDGMVRYMNPTLLKMVGVRDAQEAYGRPVSDHYSGPNRQRLQDEILPAVLRDGAWTGELPLQPTTGEPLPASHSLFLLRNEQGEPVCFANVLTDLSKLREGERALQQAHDELRQFNAELEQRVRDRTRDVEAVNRELRESEAKYSSLVEMANDGVVIIQDGLCKFANAAWARVTGYSVEELIGMPMLTAVMPEYHDIVTQRYEARVAGEDSPSVYEIKIQAKDGQVRHVELSTGVLEYEGRTASMAVIRDMTDRKEAEAERIRLTAILESTSDMVSTAGPDGRITYINRAGRELLGWTDDVVETGKPIPDVHPQWARDIVLNEGLPAAARGGLWEGETALLASDGTEIPTSQVIMAHTSPTGEIVYYSTIIRDISDRKQAEEALAKSEATARALLDAPDDVALLVEPDGKILALNETAVQRLGGSEKDLVGVCAFDLFPPEVAANRRAKAEQVIRTARAVRFEDERAGRWFDVNLFPVLDEEGGVAQIAVTARDITEPRRAEEALRQSREQLQAVTDSSPVAIAWADMQGDILYSNNKFRTTFGYTLDDMPTTDHWFRLAYPNPEYRQDVTAKWQAAVDQAMQSDQQISPIEVNIVCKDGSTRYVEVSGALLPDRVLAIFNDLTARKQAEEALRSEKDFSTTLVQASPAFIVAIAPDGKTMLMNESMRRELGYSEAEVVGTDYLTTFVPEADREHLGDVFRQLVDEEEPTTNENRVLARDGRELLVEWHGQQVFDSDGRVEYFIGVGVDITDRRRAEDALRQSELKYRQLFEEANDGIIILTPGGITDCNSRTLEMLGRPRDQIVGRMPDDFSPPAQPDGADSRKRAIEYLEDVLAGQTKVFEWLHSAADGSPVQVEVSLTRLEAEGEPRVLAIVRDITERKHLQQMMIQTEKMKTVGGLAAGVAHEINNPLAGIVQGIQNVLMLTDPGRPRNREIAEELGVNLDATHLYLDKRGVVEFLEEIRAAGRRASQVVRNMLQFSRIRSEMRVSVDLAQVLDRAVELAAHDYDLKKKLNFRDIKIRRDYDPQMPAVPCTAAEIQQVVMNLLANASHSLADASHEAPCITLRIAREQDTARIEVADNGPGMDEEVRRRVFEPFFSTKDVGEGTGLGLFVSYYIITNNHGGQIAVESTLGKGAKFIIRIPLVEG
ncbi:MAG: PAS domain S-box protein [Phycisphaerae bacterium]|jgi:PAS domain S-box-containing protein|nr:PAS domain S-box protein [Phycisphaerae bacterium]